MRWYVPDAALNGKGFFIDSFTSASTTAIPTNVETVMLGGYYSGGDGGQALYKKVAIEPAHDGKFQSLNGDWFELAKQDIFVEMFGADLMDPAHDDTAALVSAIEYCTAFSNAGNLPIRDPFVNIGWGTLTLSETIDLGSVGLKGANVFCSTILWEGDDLTGVFDKSQNVPISNIRFVNGANDPTYNISQSSSAGSTAIDWGDLLDNIYFSRCSVSSLILELSVVNTNLRSLRWNNSARMIQVNGNNSASYNRTIKIYGCSTIDFTQVADNIPVECFFEINCRNSSQIGIVWEGQRIEGDISSFANNGAIVRFNDSGGNLANNPGTVTFKDGGCHIVDDDGAKTVYIIDLQTANVNCLPNYVQENWKWGERLTMCGGTWPASFPKPVVPTSAVGFWCFGKQQGGVTNPLFMGLNSITYVGTYGAYFEASDVADIITFSGIVAADSVSVTDANITGNIVLSGNGNIITNGIAAPTAGTYKRGDIVFSRVPSAGGKAGWICTAGGTPGTWKTWGAIDV